ncbi:hypothetical protein EVAR_38853_1 [Eumeta japonica]|uniref:Uncharacterized protein n=1 Tax=Eumeta variegata TaxID=151549 RepID=A0A4C1X8E5_EUMVA|nr:hypothetical protein EVAR_38853_1 [Eumeta japonica]
MPAPKQNYDREERQLSIRLSQPRPVALTELKTGWEAERTVGTETKIKNGSGVKKECETGIERDRSIVGKEQYRDYIRTREREWGSQLNRSI